MNHINEIAEELLTAPYRAGLLAAAHSQSFEESQKLIHAIAEPIAGEYGVPIEEALENCEPELQNGIKAGFAHKAHARNILEDRGVGTYVYGSFRRPMDGLWAREINQAGGQFVQCPDVGHPGLEGPHTYVVSPKPIEQDLCNRFELQLITVPPPAATGQP